MPPPHSWIFQAIPRSRDLVAELRSTDTLSWSVARYGRDVRPGNRVYYWQAGADAGIYGVGIVRSVSTRGPDGRYTVETRHERPLFAPLTRDELREDAALHALAVLRQPRGTVFPLTPAEDLALARRTGAGALVVALPAGRGRRGTVRLREEDDAEAIARVAEAQARGDEVVAVTVDDSESGGEPVLRRHRVVAVRRGRDGTLVLRVADLADGGPASLPADVLADVSAGRAVAIPAESLPLPLVDNATTPFDLDRFGWVRQEGGTPRVAEERPAYEPRAGVGAEGFAPPTARVLGELVLPEGVAAQLVAAVRGGRHIVLMGLPGTGKTSLALSLSEAARQAGLCADPLLATATADWTTFDTIGGLVPDASGGLRFSAGVALRALRDNRWLILDELNRADIDKAFGPLLTVLSGGAVELPNVDAAGRPIRIVPAGGPARLDADGVTYYAGSDWRIVATMNTLDRAALFSYSLAFARRFAFVLVPPPAPGALVDLVGDRVTRDDATALLVRRVAQVTPRPLGPAVLLDAARYVAARGDAPAARAEAVCLFVLPQLEGIAPGALHDFAAALAPALDPDGPALLGAYIDALYGEANPG